MPVQLHVRCSRSGLVRDSGIHRTYPDIQMAQRDVELDVSRLLRHYDDVQWQLIEIPDSGPNKEGSHDK